MDNLSVHKLQKMCDAIKKKQAELLFLPVHDLDINP
jgi:hypothetical protein